MMTKGDFQAVADVFVPQVQNCKDLRGFIAASGTVDTVTSIKATTLEVMAYNLVQRFYRINSRFDHEVFYKACGFGVTDNYPRVFIEDYIEV